MCRLVLERDTNGKRTGVLLGHMGVCQNAIWFDVHNGDTVFLCVHPDNDAAQPPTLTRTLSLAAWAEIVAYVQSQLHAGPVAHG